MRLAVVLIVVLLALGAGEVATSAMQVGHAMQNNDARLAAYGVGLGE